MKTSKQCSLKLVPSFILKYEKHSLHIFPVKQNIGTRETMRSVLLPKSRQSILTFSFNMLYRSFQVFPLQIVWYFKPNSLNIKTVHWCTSAEQLKLTSPCSYNGALTDTNHTERSGLIKTRLWKHRKYNNKKTSVDQHMEKDMKDMKGL